MQDEELLALTNTLEDLLVQEFRTCQTFLNLTYGERRALTRQELPFLSTVTDEKEVLLDELSQEEDQRRAIIQKLACRKGSVRTAGNLAVLEPDLPKGLNERLNRLREGILSLSSSIQTLIHGNQRLVMQAIERIESKGEGNSSQYAVYQATFEVDQRAVSALNLFDMLS